MSWKDHPVIIAIISGAACIVFSFTVLFPIWAKSEIFHSESLERELLVRDKRISQLQSDNKASNSQWSTILKRKDEKIIELGDEILSLKKELKAASLDNLFSMDDFYPFGLRGVRIFDTTEKIYEVYPEANIEKTEYWYSVETDNELFSGVTYYFSSVKDVEFVSHILFFMRDGGGGYYVKRKLEELLSEESTDVREEFGEKLYVFNIEGAHSLALREGTYSIREDVEKTDCPWTNDEGDVDSEFLKSHLKCLKAELYHNG